MKGEGLTLQSSVALNVLFTRERLAALGKTGAFSRRRVAVRMGRHAYVRTVEFGGHRKWGKGKEERQGKERKRVEVEVGFKFKLN